MQVIIKATSTFDNRFTLFCFSLKFSDIDREGDTSTVWDYFDTVKEARQHLKEIADYYRERRAITLTSNSLTLLDKNCTAFISKDTREFDDFLPLDKDFLG